MELMTKYEYTYFIYPYIIDEKKYNSYLQKLLKNKKCKLRIFQRERDMHLYQYFLPDIRDYMFWSFGLDKKGLKAFESLDLKMQANLLAQHECNMFGYELPKNLQGKVGDGSGIFFDISEIKLICFKTGICFLMMKTTLLDNKNFTDILNFNYKFREVNSKTYHLKEYENIRLQSDIFKDVQEISTVIKEITGNYQANQKFNLDNEKMMVYSYCCLDQNSWNEETEETMMNGLFEKYRRFLPANHQIADSVRNPEEVEVFENNYVRYGFNMTGTVLLTSDINIPNYTTVAQKYESEYLYTYILELYKKLLLKKLNYDFSRRKDFKKIEKQFLDFTKKLWIQEITNDEFGNTLVKKWHNILEIEEIFLKLKREYDILYKRYNIEKTSEKNEKLTVAVVVVIVIGVLNVILQLIR